MHNNAKEQRHPREYEKLQHDLHSGGDRSFIQFAGSSDIKGLRSCFQGPTLAISGGTLFGEPKSFTQSQRNMEYSVSMSLKENEELHENQDIPVT